MRRDKFYAEEFSRNKLQGHGTLARRELLTNS